MDTHVVELHNVLFVPDLEDTLFSITEHIQSPNCSLKAEKNKYTLSNPTFNIIAKLDNEVHVNITPCTDINRIADFSSISTNNTSIYQKTLRTSYKLICVEQESLVTLLMIIIFIIIIYHYTKHVTSEISNRVSLPVVQLFESI